MLVTLPVPPSLDEVVVCPTSRRALESKYRVIDRVLIYKHLKNPYFNSLVTPMIVVLLYGNVQTQFPPQGKF